MKRLMAIILTMSMLAAPSTVAFAEGNDTEGSTQETVALTEKEKQAREDYMTVHFDLMNQLTELRVQTRATVEANNNTAKQIKEKAKGKTEINKDNVTKVKAFASETKALVEQGKQIHQQRVDIRTQYREAVKARDLEKMKALQQQMTDLNNQIKGIKSQLQGIRSQAQPLKEEIKEVRASNQQLKDSSKAHLEEVRALGQTIKAQEQEKAELWKTYRENIKAQDYTAAEETFKKIIGKKSGILENIKKRGELLNQIVVSLS